jgi:hypothetical protein
MTIWLYLNFVPIDSRFSPATTIASNLHAWIEVSNSPTTAFVNGSIDKLLARPTLASEGFITITFGGLSSAGARSRILIFLA